MSDEGAASHAGEDRYFASSSGHESEWERIRLFEAVHDPITISRLERIGVASGWSCLEVAAGGGSIAAWFGTRVGLKGAVLATDLNLRFLGHLGPPVKVEAMNLVTGDLTPDAYDLVHGRAILQHLCQDAEEVVEKMARAVKPGGWLLIEEHDYELFSSLGDHPEGLAWTEQWKGAMRSLRDAGVADMWFGRRVRGLLDGLSFEQTIGEGVTQIVRGAEAGARLIEMTSATLLAAGLIMEDLHTQTARLMNDPGLAFIDKALFGAWGRRPV